METATLFTMHRWTVAKNEDGNYDIFDHEGDYVDEATTLDDAIESCTEQATESYRQRLVEAIQNADTEGLELYTLQCIVDMLGMKATSL